MAIRKIRKLSPGEERRNVVYLSVFYTCALVFAVFIIVHSLNDLHRQRPSLQWPTVTGVMMQADIRAHSGRNSTTYTLTATYTYKVNGVRHVSNQLSLWSPDLAAGDARGFALAHPVRSSVEVFYDPQDPANAVLVPGADELAGRIGIWCGATVICFAVFGLVYSRGKYVRLTAQCAEEKARPRQPVTAKRERAESRLSAHPFLTWSPGSKRKLDCLPDEASLLDILGHDGKKLMDWQPDDRAVDSTGRLFRIVPNIARTRYDIEPTGETWTWQKLLDLACQDAALMKRDPKSIRNRVESVPESERIVAIMQSVDALPAAPVFVWIGLGLFLLLFFVAVAFAAGYLVMWLQRVVR